VFPGGIRNRRSAAAIPFAVLVAAAGCAGAGGGITVDGSSTVGPYLTAAAESFRQENADARITVGISGTGGGFERFCRGETDLNDASRAIKEEEVELCERNGVEYVEFLIANDALTVVVNPANDWATCLTAEELARIWGPGSEVGSWAEVREGFPDVALKLFGPGTDSGTFDYFTEAVNGDEGASRTDFSASEDDNVIVQGVAGERGGLGYLGFSYFEENAERLKAVEIDGGGGCVAPSAAAAQDGTYTPLARPLFVYVKKSAFAREEVADFVGFILDNEASIAEKADFISLNEEQLARARRDYEAALAEARTDGER
jgi:phosphate transport system substrate-binding protein